MSSQQRAAMAQAALINFFGESGIVSSIMHTVQPSQTQTVTEQSNQPELNVSNNLQGMFLPISTHQTSYTIPHITIQEEQLQTLILQHNKTTTKFTEYHNTTLILILILIEE